MKFNLLAGISLLMISNVLGSLEAEPIDHVRCNQSNDCSEVLSSKPEGENLVNLARVKTRFSLPQGKVVRVADLKSGSSEKAAPLQSINRIAQITTPTDSNGNRIFRSTRSGPGYLGVGGNFGITGDSDLGGRSLAIISKLGLNDTTSVRPTILLLRNFATFLLPLTYDFELQQPFGGLTLAPYVGGGVAVTTGTNSTFGPMLTAGVDIPISANFTVNVAANLAFVHTTDLGILVGIGYNF